MAKEENVGCSNNCQQQWKLSSFGLNHHQPRDFVTFQVSRPTVRAQLHNVVTILNKLKLSLRDASRLISLNNIHTTEFIIC